MIVPYWLRQLILSDIQSASHMSSHLSGHAITEPGSNIAARPIIAGHVGWMSRTRKLFYKGRNLPPGKLFLELEKISHIDSLELCEFSRGSDNKDSGLCTSPDTGRSTV